MKKIFILMTIMVLASTMVYAAENNEALTRQKIHAMHIQKMNAFEKRLALTEEQKIQAKEIRMKGHEQLRPVIEEIKNKKQEAKMVKMSRIAVQVQEERLEAIDKELRVLEKKAHDIRKANMKEFESILTRNQKRILKQMKKEGRKNYHQIHPGKPMMQMPIKVNK